MRGMVKRRDREGEDGTGRGPGNKVVRGGEERGDLEGGALVLTNDWIIGCREREIKRNDVLCHYHCRTFQIHAHANT